MTLELTQEQEILRETVREFAAREIAPFASAMDKQSLVPENLLAKLPSLGLFGISVPSKYGGAGADFLGLMIACEELSKVSGSLGALLSFHNAVVCEGFIASSNLAMKESFLPKLVSGTLGTFDFPSHSNSSKISCKIEGSDLIVNGHSEYVTGGAKAGIFLVCCNLERKADQPVLFAFLKDDFKESFSVGEMRKLMGMRASAISKIEFNNLRVPLDSLLCEVANTKEFFGQLQARARLAVASQALGIAQASIDAEVKYANERKQFDRQIGDFYAVQEMIASDEIEVETARSLCYEISSEIARSKNLQRGSAIAKVSASNAALNAARHSIRVHGGYGFTRAYPVERYVRDARLTQIYTETNEDLNAVIAGSLLGRN